MRREDVLDDPAHRRVEPAGRVERQYDELRVRINGARQSALHVLGGRRTDDAGHVQRNDRVGRVSDRRRAEERRD
jgi:hypothetical protein